MGAGDKASDKVVHDSYPVEDEQRAYMEFARYVCMGVPPDYIKVSTGADHREIVTLYRDPFDLTPPGVSTFKEHREAKNMVFDQLLAKLERALDDVTGGWAHHSSIRYSESKGALVLALDVGFPRDNPEHEDGLEGLDRFFKGIFKDTRVQSECEDITYYDQPEHKLHSISDAGLTFELPLGPELLKLNRCETLARYDGGDDGQRHTHGGGRRF